MRSGNLNAPRKLLFWHYFWYWVSLLLLLCKDGRAMNRGDNATLLKHTVHVAHLTAQLRKENLFPYLSILYVHFNYNLNPHSHTLSQILPFFLKNILIKCIILIVWPINQKRSWPGVFTCPSHHPGHLSQVQDEQEQLFYTSACGGREGSGCRDFAVGWKLDVPDANIWTQELRKNLQCHVLGTVPVTSGTFSRAWAFWGLSCPENRTSGCFCKF